MAKKRKAISNSCKPPISVEGTRFYVEFFRQKIPFYDDRLVAHGCEGLASWLGLVQRSTNELAKMRHFGIDKSIDDNFSASDVILEALDTDLSHLGSGL